MFSYSQNDLYCEQVPLADLAARTGTPAYVYSSQTLLDNYRAYDEAFGEIGRVSDRESDWSSDVCSSDLIANRSHWPTWPRAPARRPTFIPAKPCSTTTGPTMKPSARSEECRIGKVTGVQTCALPILLRTGPTGRPGRAHRHAGLRLFQPNLARQLPGLR